MDGITGIETENPTFAPTENPLENKAAVLPEDDLLKQQYPAWAANGRTDRLRKMDFTDDEITKMYQDHEATYYKYGIDPITVNSYLGRTIETHKNAKRIIGDRKPQQIADFAGVSLEEAKLAIGLSEVMPGVPLHLMLTDKNVMDAVQKKVLIEMGKPLRKATFSQMVDAWRISDKQGELAAMYARKALYGGAYQFDELRAQELNDEIAKLQQGQPIMQSFFQKMASGTAELAEQLGDQVIKGAIGGLLAGPIGMGVGAAHESWLREVGGMYQELEELGIDSSTARALSLAFGSLSAAVDFIQSKMLLKQFGKPLNAAAKKLIGREIFGVAPEVIKAAATNPSLLSRVGGALAANLGNSALEIGQEGLQRAIVIAGRELGKHLSDMELSSSGDNIREVLEEMLYAAPGMLGLGFLGIPFGVGRAVQQARIDSKIESQTNVVNQLEADIRSGKVDAEAKVRTGDTTAAVNKGVFSKVLRFFNGTLFQAEQMGEDINPLLVELSLDPEVYEETSDTEDIFIPRRIYENMLAKLPEEQAEMLRNNVRIREEEITYKEKLVRERRALDRLIQDPLLADTEEGAMARALKEKVARNAIERGRPAQEAADCGTLWARLAIIATREAGITVDQFGKLIIKYPDKKTLEAIRRGDYDEAVGLAQRESFQTDTTLRPPVYSGNSGSTTVNVGGIDVDGVLFRTDRSQAEADNAEWLKNNTKPMEIRAWHEAAREALKRTNGDKDAAIKLLEDKLREAEENAPPKRYPPRRKPEGVSDRTWKEQKRREDRERKEARQNHENKVTNIRNAIQSAREAEIIEASNPDASSVWGEGLSPDPNTMLVLDTKIKDQPQAVQDAIRAMVEFLSGPNKAYFGPENWFMDYKGSDIYGWLRRRDKGNPSSVLADYGLMGAMLADGSSYAVWDGNALSGEVESQTATGEAELDAELDAAEAEAEADLKEAEQSEAEATREVTPEVQAVLDALNRQSQGKKPTSDGPKAKQPRYQNLRPVSPKGVVYCGSYKYDAKRDQHIVTLFSTANSSTLVHEIGHAFLTVLANMATSENASQWVREDWENTKKFLGVGEDGVITRKMNEKFADGFLNYLYKQEAPASALQGVFSRFKRWLAELFEQARISDIELSDGVKDVYAHLIALPGEYDERRQLIREAISEDDRVRIMWEVQELEYWVSMFGEQARDWEDEIFRFFRSQEFAEDYRREAGLTEEQILLERKKDFAYFVKKFMAQELKAVRKERDRALEKLEHETQMKDNANARTKEAREKHAKAVKAIREKYRNQIKEIRAKRDEKIAKLKEEFNDRFAAYKEKNKNRDELKKIIKKLRRMYRDKGLRMTAEYRDILRDTVDQVELRVAKVSGKKLEQREAMRNLMNELDEQGIEQDDIISALREQGFSAADIVALNQTPLSDMTMPDARQFLKDVEAIYEVGVAKRKEELALEHAERAEAAKIMIERINSVAGRGRVITDSKDVHHDYSFGAGMDALVRTEQEMLIHKVDQDLATRKMEGEEISTEERQRLYDEAMQEGRRRAEQNPRWKKLLVNLKHSSEWFTHAATSLLADIARLSDTLDGGKATYDGPFHQIFVREKNTCDDNYQRNVERRIGEATFARFINEAGFDIRWLTEKIDLSATDHVFAAYARGQQMTFGDMLGFYLASKDPKARKAAIHGNLNGLPDPKYREAVYERIINGDFMQDKEKWAKGIAFADIVYDILNDNDAFDRMNRVHVKLTNKKVKKEDRYVSIMRMEQVGKFSEVVDPTLASSQNKFLNDDNVLKSPGTPGFTINRVNISDAHQTAILLDPLKILTRHVQAEEHYIAYGEYLKRVFDLMKYDDPTSRNGVSRAIENKFGMFIRDALRRYYNETAVPSIFRAQDTLDNVLGKAARNTAVASLAANTAVLMKNFISVGKWLIDAGPVSVLESLGEFISSPNKFMERVAMMDPQIARRRGNVLLEMQRYDYNTRLGKWNSVLNKLVEGNAVIDRWVSSIMFMSVYNHNISKGVDADTAIRMAQESVQRNMQPATYADLPDLWRRGGAFKMLLLFSSEGAKLLQILGFDLPRRLRSGAWVGAGQILIASGICAAIQGLLAHGAPDDDDDNSWYNWYMNAMMEHSVGGLPGIGDVLMQMWSGGYYSSGNSMVQPISNFFYGLRNVFTDDGKRMKSGYTRTEAGIFQLLSSVSMLSGLFPAGATKHFYDAIFKAEDPAEALLILTGNYDVQREARKR